MTADTVDCKWRNVGVACGEAVADLVIEICPAIGGDALNALFAGAERHLSKIMLEKGVPHPDAETALNAMAAAFKSRLACSK